MPDFEIDFDSEIDRHGTDSIKWDDAVTGQLSMSLADMDFRTAPVVLEALQRQIDHGIYGYTDVGSGFLEAICGWVSRRRGWAIEPEWIVPGPGVLPLVAHLLRAGLEPGATVIVQTPAFPPIPDTIEANGFGVVESRLELVDGAYEMDLDGFRELAERPEVGAFVLCSPHNPSGRVWSRRDLAVISEIADQNDLLVISDEIHGEVIFPWAEFVSYGTVASGDTPHAVCFGPSKGFNLAAMRLAIAAVADDHLRANLRDQLFKVNEGFGISGPGAVALQAAYTGGDMWLDALGEYLEHNVATLSAGLAAESVPIVVVRPDSSFLVWLDCRGTGLDDDAIMARFAEVGLMVEPGLDFGGEGSGFVRLNIGTTNRRVVEAVDRIAVAFGTANR